MASVAKMILKPQAVIATVLIVGILALPPSILDQIPKDITTNVGTIVAYAREYGDMAYEAIKTHPEMMVAVRRVQDSKNVADKEKGFTIEEKVEVALLWVNVTLDPANNSKTHHTKDTIVTRLVMIGFPLLVALFIMALRFVIFWIGRMLYHSWSLTASRVRSQSPTQVKAEHLH